MNDGFVVDANQSTHKTHTPDVSPPAVSGICSSLKSAVEFKSPNGGTTNALVDTAPAVHVEACSNRTARTEFKTLRPSPVAVTTTDVSPGRIAKGATDVIPAMIQPNGSKTGHDK